MTEWVQMLVTMADGPRQQVHGTVVPYRNSEEPFHYYLGTYGEEPVFLPYHREGLRLYRWGAPIPDRIARRRSAVRQRR